MFSFCGALLLSLSLLLSLLLLCHQSQKKGF
jgi:hypothetical protein